MNHLNGHYYVEVKDHQYRIHPAENIIFGERDPPKSLRTQYRAQNETEIRKIKKILKIIMVN